MSQHNRSKLGATFHPKFKHFWLDQLHFDPVEQGRESNGSFCEMAIREGNEDKPSTISTNKDKEGEDDFFGSI